MLAGVITVQGWHTDRVYVQPINEIRFKDDWKEQYPSDGVSVAQVVHEATTPGSL